MEVRLDPVKPRDGREAMKFQKNHVISLLVTMLVFGILAFLYSKSTLLEGLEWGAIDLQFFLRAPGETNVKLEEGVRLGRINPRARKDLLILGIDEDTFREFDSQQISWPYPWSVYAKFIDYVSTGEPNAILMDIMFLDHKPFIDEFAASMERAGNVFIDYMFETQEAKPYADHERRMALLNKVRWKVPDDDKTPEIIESVTPPVPKLIEASRGVGHANIFTGSPYKDDKVARTMPLVMKFHGYYYPNIDLSVLMHYYGIKKEDVEIKIGSYIKLKNVPVEKMAKPNSEREIVIPVDEFGFMDVNYIGGSGSYQHYSFYLFNREGNMMKERNTSLKDKIVMIAAYNAVGIALDTHHSPYSTTFGIEHHANTLNTVMNQDFLYKLTIWQNLLIMLVIALFMGLLLPRLSIGAAVVTTVGLIVIYIGTSIALFDLSSVIVALATPSLEIAFSFTFIIVYRVITEQREKRYIRQTFSKFVSKSVVDELLKHPDKVKLGGEKKILTVLFSDIRGFTSISEKLTPEQLVEHLNIYLQAMTEIVFKLDGTLDKYVGDEIMAFWGAPVPQDNHALLACKACLEMMRDLDKLNEKWRHEGKPTLNIGIGLNTGDMVVGNMGSASRMDYTLMGDMVNLGARLEGTNKVYGTNIIISEFTYEHVRDQVVVRELDLIKVKGKELPVRIYELLDVTA